MMMRILNSFCLILLAFISYGQNFDFLPTSTTGEIIQHSYYTLSYSQPHKQAEWVAYELTAENVNGTTARKDRFRPDPKVSNGSAQLVDYKGCGYDRGHLAPAADMKMNATSMSECFYLSNMSPQEPSFNRGKWSALENQFRNWALSKGSIYIITGGVLTSSKGVIGDNRISVPALYYKMALCYEGEKCSVIAFLMPNQKIEGPIENYMVTIDSVERVTGIDFFPELPDEVEDDVESKINKTEWECSFGPVKSNAPTSNSSASVQCNGIAKSTGVRCENKTRHSSGYCHHHVSQDGKTTAPTPSRTSTTSKQCSGHTKTGNRCKRMTKDAEGRCYQH